MKTKNVKVRAHDVRQGRVAYVAHPVYGIEKVTFASRPYMNKTTNSLFVRTKVVSRILGCTYEGTQSLCDMGITALYNGRRTFWKLKQAEEWVKKWSASPSFQAQHADHEEFCAMMDEIERLYEEYDYDEVDSEVFN